MSKIYKTIQGDTWDLMAYKLFGDEKYMSHLLDANWPLIDVLIFPSGVQIMVPDIPEDADEDAPFWRREQDDSDNITFSDDDYEEVEG